MGKYSHVVKNLPRMTDEEPSYQERVNREKQRVLQELPKQSTAFAKRYAELRNGEGELPEEQKSEFFAALIKQLGKDGIEELMSACNLQITAIEQLMLEQFEAEGDLTSLKLDGIGSISVQLEPYAQVVDKEAYRQWCIAEGFESLMSVPWPTTNSETKRRLLEGEPEPPGVKAYCRSKFVFRRKA